MLKLMHKFKKDEKGQAMVELALTLPILLLILCGIIDFGWFYSNQLSVSYLSREGSRYGAVNSSSAYDVEQRVKAIAPSYMVSSMTVNVVYSNSSSHKDGDISVEVTTPVKALTPIAGVFTEGQVINITSKCVMKVE